MPDLIHTPKHKDLIYDVGMHKGEDTAFYLRKGFRVIAFEADPDLAAFCRSRFKEDLARGRLVIVEGAVVDPEAIQSGRKKVPFYKNDAVSVWGTIRVNRSERNVRLGTSPHRIEIDAINLADVMRRHGVPYYLKTDIEGADLACIRTLTLFQNRPDYISMESDIVSFANIRREIDTLAELGYDRFQAVEQSALPVSQSPPFPPTEGRYVASHTETGNSGLFGSELGGNWKTRRGILFQYRVIMLGYCLLGDDGIMRPWQFRGAGKLRSLVRRFLTLLTRASVPGWYDTHARHACADAARD